MRNSMDSECSKETLFLDALLLLFEIRIASVGAECCCLCDKTFFRGNQNFARCTITTLCIHASPLSLTAIILSPTKSTSPPSFHQKNWSGSLL
mmetsp:Transcript_7217/g.27031  ORF Transcript_7217/g.27031 Transcript_7217/m.27031 type:complete len:93 (-) Transcript_7217:1877-2155(-)